MSKDFNVKANLKGDIPDIKFGKKYSLQESFDINKSIYSEIDANQAKLDETVKASDIEDLKKSIARDVAESNARVNKTSAAQKVSTISQILGAGVSIFNALTASKGLKSVASAAQAGANKADYSSLSDKEIETKISTLTSQILLAKADFETAKGLKTKALSDKRTYNDLIEAKTKESNEQQKIYKTQCEEYTKQDNEYKKQDGIVNDTTAKLTNLNTQKTIAEANLTALVVRENSTTNPLSEEEKATLNKLRGPVSQEGSVKYINNQIKEETERKNKAEQDRKTADEARKKADDARNDAAQKKADADNAVKENTSKWENASKDAEKYQTDVTKKEQEIKNKENELQNLQTEQAKRSKK